MIKKVPTESTFFRLCRILNSAKSWRFLRERKCKNFAIFISPRRNRFNKNGPCHSESLSKSKIMHCREMDAWKICQFVVLHGLILSKASLRYLSDRFVKPCLKNLSVTEGRRKSKDMYDLFLIIIVGAFPVSEAIPVSDFFIRGSPLVSPNCLRQQEHFSMSIAKEC